MINCVMNVMESKVTINLLHSSVAVLLVFVTTVNTVGPHFTLFLVDKTTDPCLRMCLIEKNSAEQN